MFNVWLMNLQAQPPTIEARVQAKDRATLVASAQALARAFPEGHFTLVHQVNAEPLDIDFDVVPLPMPGAVGGAAR